ncbi:hypothetical protein Tco_0121841 [Tanacetum coccineum]
MHQTFEKSSLVMTHKFDDMVKLLKSHPKKTYKEDLECEMVMVKIPRCMSWLGSTDAYDEPIGSLDMMNNKVNSNPQSTPQVLPSFEGYIPPVTYLEEVEENIGIPMKVDPLDETQLEELGLNTCNNNISLSSREVPSFDEPEPQPRPLPSCPSLDVSLGEERSSKPPIKPHSLDSLRMKVIDPLTIHTPPLPHVASFHLKDVYCYYHPCIDDLKKHYEFKPSLLGHRGKLGVDFSNLEMIENDWQLESKEVSFLGEGLNLPVRPKELENGSYVIAVEDWSFIKLMAIYMLRQVEKQSTWMAFGGNTRDLGSFGKETDEITTLHQSRRKKCAQWLETSSKILVTPSELASDGVKLFETASERNRLNKALEDSVKRRR